ncbi:hypothetical protein EVAR_20183_1 [Eumeta japonica]|uniref:Uncharacterized protein n=1 Tax=Eumeta variegata TaxID=151549 RepID=A0A4C1UVN1_EUMVA|nr:hypothetical protein EVAR_20183_1 [Eumeta japonica]
MCKAYMIKEDKWSKIVTRWYPREGKRKRGRPQKRWGHPIFFVVYLFSLRQVAGVTWKRVAQERHVWKKLINGPRERVCEHPHAVTSMCPVMVLMPVTGHHGSLRSLSNCDRSDLRVEWPVCVGRRKRLLNFERRCHRPDVTVYFTKFCD